MKVKIFLHNTLTRKKEEFKPLKTGRVGFYTCGPTVYNYAHIGNLRTYVNEDVIKRVLLYNGFKVKHVMNYTDVGHLTSDSDTGEDKMELARKRERKTAWQVAEFYSRAFENDIKSLDIIPADIIAKATDHIKEQIELIRKLEKNELTYTTVDGVYFDTSKIKDYGKLAKLDIRGLKAGARIEVGEKRNPTDFALWKFSPREEKRDMEWDSPWGVGFPGWHIECSAMSMKYLGETFDIHAGGIDHIPVHHTNEIAQSEGATGKKFVNYWLHSDFLIMGKGKMAKSEGTFITLNDLIRKGYDPLAYRYFCLTAHYRTQLLFSYENLDAAKNTYDGLKRKIIELKRDREKFHENNVEEYMKRFLDAVDDDFDTPKALALLHEVLKSGLKDCEKYHLALDFDKVLGLGLGRLKEEKVNVPSEIQKLLDERAKARKAKDWKKADEIRDTIKKKEFNVLDSPDGQKLERMR